MIFGFMSDMLPLLIFILCKSSLRPRAQHERTTRLSRLSRLSKLSRLSTLSIKAIKAMKAIKAIKPIITCKASKLLKLPRLQKLSWLEILTNYANAQIGTSNRLKSYCEVFRRELEKAPLGSEIPQCAGGCKI